MRVVEHPVAAPVPPRLHASATGFAAAGYSVDRCAAGHCRHFPVPCVLCRTRVPQAWLFTCALFCCQATRVACCQATPLRAVGAVFLYAALSLCARFTPLTLCRGPSCAGYFPACLAAPATHPETRSCPQQLALSPRSSTNRPVSVASACTDACVLLLVACPALTPCPSPPRAVSASPKTRRRLRRTSRASLVEFEPEEPKTPLV